MRRYIPSSNRHCDIAKQKKQLRTKKRIELENLPESYIAASNAEIEAKMLNIPEYIAAKRVFAYCSVGREVATQGIIAHALSVGKQVALPVCGDGFHMSFREVFGLNGLKPGKFNIPEPECGTPGLIPEQGDIMIVPALCCDEQGSRLGHGAGYYDRYLAKASCFTVCLCRKLLLEKCLPTEPSDIKVRMVLTE